MKKQIIIIAAVTTCAALCTAVWPRSNGDGKVPAEPVNPAVIAEKASPEETLPNFPSNDTFAPKPEAVTESEPAGTEGITTEEKNEPTPMTPVTTKSSTKPSSDPEPGTTSIINGERYSWFPGFGWVKDEGAETTVTIVDGEGDINKQVGFMGDDSGGTVAADMYENGNKIGAMGGEEPHDSNASSPSAEKPQSTGDEINIVFVEAPEKNSTQPPDKPDTMR